MSAIVNFTNATQTKVTVAFYSAPHDHKSTKEVNAGKTETLEIKNYDARIIACWINSDLLYPNNDNAVTASMFVQDKKTYDVTLQVTGRESSITVKEAAMA